MIMSKLLTTVYCITEEVCNKLRAFLRESGYITELDTEKPNVIRTDASPEISCKEINRIMGK